MTQQEIASMFADEPTLVGSVTVPDKSIVGRVLRRKSTISLSVGIIPSGKVQKIGAILKGMTGFDDIKELSQPDQINKLLSDDIRPIIDIVGLAVSHTRNQSTDDILNAISDQWGIAQLNYAFSEVYRRLDLEPFFGILSLTKNLTISLFPDQEAHGQTSLAPQ